MTSLSPAMAATTVARLATDGPTARKVANALGEIFDAAELEKMEFDPVKSVVPGVFVEGLTLFCGKPLSVVHESKRYCPEICEHSAKQK